MLNDKIIKFAETFDTEMVCNKSNILLLETIPNNVIKKYLFKAMEHNNTASFLYLLHNNVNAPLRSYESKILFDVCKECIHLQKSNIMQVMLDYCILDNDMINKVLTYLLDTINSNNTKYITSSTGIEFTKLLLQSNCISVNLGVISRMRKLRKNFYNNPNYTIIFDAYDEYIKKRNYTNRLIAQFDDGVARQIVFDSNKIIPFCYCPSLFMYLCAGATNMEYINECLIPCKLTFLMKCLLLVSLYNKNKLELLQKCYEQLNMAKYFNDVILKIVNIKLLAEISYKYGKQGSLFYFIKNFSIYYESFDFAFNTLYICASEKSSLKEIEWICDKFTNILTNSFSKIDSYKLMYQICDNCLVEVFEYLDNKLRIFTKPNAYYELILAKSIETKNIINGNIYQNVQVTEYLCNKFNKYKMTEPEYVMIEVDNRDEDADVDVKSEENNFGFGHGYNSDRDEVEDDENQNQEIENIIDENIIDDDIVNIDGVNYRIVKIYDYVALSDIEKKYSAVINTKRLANKKKALGITKQISLSKSLNKNIKSEDTNYSQLTTQNNTNCLICLDNNKELLQLNCGHHFCITCLCQWFRNNNEQKKDICVYCKHDIIWSECQSII